jgi:hypothetical protein
MESTLPGLPVGSCRVHMLRSKEPPGAQVARVKRALGDRFGDQLERGAADVSAKRESAEGMIGERCILNSDRRMLDLIGRNEVILMRDEGSER